MSNVRTLNTPGGTGAILHRLGLDVRTHPGTMEVIQVLLALHLEPLRTHSSQEDFLADYDCVIAYWKLVSDIARACPTPWFAGAEAVPDRVYAALVGGVDLLADEKTRAWKTPGARAGYALMVETVKINDAHDFASASPEAQMVVGVNICADLCSAYARMETRPDDYKNLPLAKIEGMGMARAFNMPASPLARTIDDCERMVAARWRGLNPPRGGTEPRPGVV